MAKKKKRRLTPIQKAARARERRKAAAAMRPQPAVQIWMSNITGRTYISERRMRAAEASHARMRGELAVSRYIQEHDIGGLPYTSLHARRNQWGHGTGTIMNILFYDIQDGNWDYLEKNTISQFLKTYGMDYIDIQGHTIYEFVEYVVRGQAYGNARN